MREGDSLKDTLVALLLWCGLAAVVFPGLLSFSAADLPDELLEFNATSLSFFADELRAGHASWWNPYKHGGGSVFGDPTCLAPFYPGAILLALLPLDLFVALAWLLHLAIGCLGTERWVRQLGAERGGGAAAGIAMLLSTIPVAAVLEGQLDTVTIIAWFPWAMLALQRTFVGLAAQAGSPEHAARWRQAAMAGLYLGLVGLGAHPRFAAIAFLAAGVGGLAQWLLPTREQRPGPIAWASMLGTALALGGLLAAPAVLPALAEVALSRSGPPDDAAALVGQVFPLRGLTGLLYPRPLVFDERWYRIGACLLLPLLTLPGDRRGRALLGAALVLLLLGMGTRGPLFPLVRPLHWLLYPVETGVASMAVPFLAAAVGVALDRLCQRPDPGQQEADRRVPGPLLSSVLALVAGTIVVWLGYAASSGLYDRGIRSVHRLETASLVHGLLAVGAVSVALLVCRRLRGRGLGVLLMLVLLADGFAYSWRAEAAIPSSTMRPSEFVAAPEALQGLRPEQPPGGRVLMWPLQSIRDFSGCLDDEGAPGHGWGTNRRGDPVASIPRDARALLEVPLRRNAGARGRVPQVGGRAKVPPMPWSVLAWWLSDGGPLDPGGRRGPGPPPTRGPGGGGGEPTAGGCARGPLDLGREGADLWVPTTLELLHVAWVVSEHSTVPLPGVQPIAASTAGIHRFAVPDPRPPALLSPRVELVATVAEAEQLVFGGQLDLRRSAVVLEKDLARGPDGHGEPVAPAIIAWRPGRWELDLPSTPGLLTVAERHHPGWTARDQAGRDLTVVPANFVQLGVVVPPGTTRVHLRFRPPGLPAAALAGLLGLGLFVLLFRPRAPRRRRPGRRA